MKRLLVALVLLTLLVALAAPALAGSSTVPQRQAPGWQQLFPATKPSARSSHAMAYDVDRGVAVLFGGVDDGGYYRNDTWEFDSQTLTWTERQPAHKPSVRTGHVMAYDEARDVTVLFGGNGPGVGDYSDETWFWSGSDWTQIFPTDSPSPRWLSAMTYDVQAQGLVLFGGSWSALDYGDSWEWTGENWVEQSISGPSPRSGAFLAYDRRRQVMVLFGGSNAVLGFFNDLWERAGSNAWQEVTPAQSPSPRSRGGAVYLPQARRIFMYGGSTFTYYDDMIIWNGQAWATRPFNPNPPGRCCTAMVYDPVLKGVLLFGGSVSWVIEDDMWLFK